MTHRYFYSAQRFMKGYQIRRRLANMVGYDWLKGTSPDNSDIDVTRCHTFSQPDATTAVTTNKSPLSPKGDCSLVARVGFQSERAETRPVRDLLFISQPLLSSCLRLVPFPLPSWPASLLLSYVRTLQGYKVITFSHIQLSTVLSTDWLRELRFQMHPSQ